MPKYKTQESSYDFRFTDIEALSKADIQKRLNEIREPDASDLFLTWQLLSRLAPSNFNQKDIEAIKQLALSSHTLKIDKANWELVTQLVQKNHKKIKLKIKKESLATFFLP
jgi:hypothetical protein